MTTRELGKALEAGIVWIKTNSGKWRLLSPNSDRDSLDDVNILVDEYPYFIRVADIQLGLIVISVEKPERV